MEEMRKTLDICMIVKNEAENLIKTLPNNIAGADNVIVVDTGSSDKTKEIAASLGAKVFDFKWEDDFAAARNFSLAQSNADWILWLDADEYMEIVDLKKLKDFINGIEANLIRLPIHECEYGTNNSKTFYFRDKLFKNNIGVHFERCINEQLVFDKDVDFKQVVISDINIYHWGRLLEKDAKFLKIKGRIKLYEEALKKKPADPAYNFLLADRLSEIERWHDAIAFYDKAIEFSRNNNNALHILENSHLKKGWLLIDKINDFEAAASEGLAAIECNNDNIESYCLYSKALMGQRKYLEALKILEQAILMHKMLHSHIDNNDFYWDIMRFQLYALCLAYLNKKEECLAFLKKLMESNSNELFVRFYNRIKGAA